MKCKRSIALARGLSKKYGFTAKRYKTLRKQQRFLIADRLERQCPKFKRYLWKMRTGYCNTSTNDGDVYNHLKEMNEKLYARMTTWKRVKVTVYGWVLIPRRFEISFRGAQGESKTFECKKPHVLIRKIAAFLMDKINTFQDKTLAHIDDPIMLPFKSDRTRMEEFVLAALHRITHTEQPITWRDVDFTAY